MRTIWMCGIVAATFGFGAAAAADDVKMTGEEIRQALSGNKVQYNTQWGYAEAYRGPDGIFFIRNSKGERGRGTWTIENDQLCTKWTERHMDWRVSDGCTSLTRVNETTLRTEKGVDWVISQGDPTKVKLD